MKLYYDMLCYNILHYIPPSEGAVHDPRGADQRAEGDVLRSDPPDDGPRGIQGEQMSMTITLVNK